MVRVWEGLGRVYELCLADVMWILMNHLVIRFVTKMWHKRWDNEKKRDFNVMSTLYTQYIWHFMLTSNVKITVKLITLFIFTPNPIHFHSSMDYWVINRKNKIVIQLSTKYNKSIIRYFSSIESHFILDSILSFTWIHFIHTYIVFIHNFILISIVRQSIIFL